MSADKSKDKANLLAQHKGLLLVFYRPYVAADNKPIVPIKAPSKYPHANPETCDERQRRQSNTDHKYNLRQITQGNTT
jgi:hypothetical protein